MVKHIPDLKYTPVFVAFTFHALLETDMQKAYNFARETMNAPVWYDDPPYSVLMQAIEDNAEKLRLPEIIYRLGAECYQALIDRNPYPEYGDIPGQYKKMANLYRLAGDFEKASEAERAIISPPEPRKSP
ncbi:hypothetical protein [Pedobacter sp. JY14-1]|uniref:hypothetical protein n=1 Tax=Pedobacter sp. JY14-1 TaxID=3034151 RepID=UPI0023E1AC6B|nr:hypothetical protein [Pedobacter sp. JY14-1]